MMKSQTATQPGMTVNPYPIVHGKTGTETPSLLVALQRVYKERWAILLDAIFSNQPAERIKLQNPFIKGKVRNCGVFKDRLLGLPGCPTEGQFLLKVLRHIYSCKSKCTVF